MHVSCFSLGFDSHTIQRYGAMETNVNGMLRGEEIYGAYRGNESRCFPWIIKIIIIIKICVDWRDFASGIGSYTANLV